VSASSAVLVAHIRAPPLPAGTLHKSVPSQAGRAAHRTERGSAQRARPAGCPRRAESAAPSDGSEREGTRWQSSMSTVVSTLITEHCQAASLCRRSAPQSKGSSQPTCASTNLQLHECAAHAADLVRRGRHAEPPVRIHKRKPGGGLLVNGNRTCQSWSLTAPSGTYQVTPRGRYACNGMASERDH